MKDKYLKIGRLEFCLMDRLKDDDGVINDDMSFIDYAGWCFNSETVFFWKWELNIQNRRLPEKK
jgi:hypothetical protein